VAVTEAAGVSASTTPDTATVAVLLSGISVSRFSTEHDSDAVYLNEQSPIGPKPWRIGDQPPIGDGHPFFATSDRPNQGATVPASFWLFDSGDVRGSRCALFLKLRTLRI
jgi:hypothetical protein